MKTQTAEKDTQFLTEEEKLLKQKQSKLTLDFLVNIHHQLDFLRYNLITLDQAQDFALEAAKAYNANFKKLKL